MTSWEIGILFEQHQRHLLSVIRQTLPKDYPSDLIYDCLEEVFTKALKEKENPNFNDHPEKWLVRTAKYVACNFDRKHSNRLKFYDHSVPFDLRPLAAQGSMFDDLAIKLALEDNLWDKIMQELSYNERVLFTMFFHQNISIDDLAESFGTSKNAVRVRITRLKKNITLLVYKYVGAGD